MAEKKVDVLHAEPLEAPLNAFKKVFAVERVLFIWAFVDAPEELGRHEVRAAPEAEFAEGLSHDGFGLAACIDFGVIEKVDAMVVGELDHLRGGLGVYL